MNNWYLVYLLSVSTGGGLVEYIYPMPSQEACLASVKEAQIEVPGGGDAESTVTIFCVNGKGVRP